MPNRHVPKPPRYYGTLFWNLFNDQDIFFKLHKRWGQMIHYPFINILMFWECIQTKIVIDKFEKINLEDIGSKMHSKNANMIFYNKLMRKICNYVMSLINVANSI